MDFKDTLKDLRKIHKISQQLLADRIGISQSLVAQWERGECTPNPDTSRKLAEFFQTDINGIMGFTTEREKLTHQKLKELEIEKYETLPDEDKQKAAKAFNEWVTHLYRKK
ncbi:XRE family transcriptional regulator [bacterium]|nr:XRE family transcriptional regulator [bacterium]